MDDEGSGAGVIEVVVVGDGPPISDDLDDGSGVGLLEPLGDGEGVKEFGARLGVDGVAST